VQESSPEAKAELIAGSTFSACATLTFSLAVVIERSQTPGQPLGAVLQAPLHKPCLFVELADHHQQFIGRRVDAGAKRQDVVIEDVDRDEFMRLVGRLDGSSRAGYWGLCLYTVSGFKTIMKQCVRRKIAAPPGPDA